jgi:LysR family hydrogen peroxide-inducible transcriptional activator
MTLTQLNYIVAVDRCRNFAQAARECFVTQPTLSMQIQKLEDYLQIIVFDRGKTPVEPTPMGKKVLEHARTVLRAASELEDLSKSLRGVVAGEFILAVIPTLAPYVLPRFVQKFVAAYPRVELKIYEHQTDDIVKLLKEGKLDAGLLATPLEVKEIAEEHLFYEPFRVFLSPNHPLLKKKAIDEADLDLREAWLLKEGHCLRAQALNLCQVNKATAEARHLYFEAGSLETLVNFVKAGQGFTVLPYLAAENLGAADQKLLRDFKGHLPVRDIAFVTGPHSMKKSIEAALVKTILKNIPKYLAATAKNTEVVAIR